MTTEQASEDQSSEWERYRSASLAAAAEYVSRVSRLAPLVPLVPLAPAVRARPAAAARAYSPPALPLAAELARSLLYDRSLDDAPPDSLWNNKPQQYFESINADDDYDSDSLAP